MSYKIVDIIKKLKGMPGKHKRVLEAWASYANKDGTGIRPSKEKVGERAGISRWTVYRSTDVLVSKGILVPYDKHVYPNGHWTSIYKIDVSLLQNATWDEPAPCSKLLQRHCSKTPKTSVAKCDAILPLKTASSAAPSTSSSNPVILDPSVTSVTVDSKETSEAGSPAATVVVTPDIFSTEIERAVSMWDRLLLTCPNKRALELVLEVKPALKSAFTVKDAGRCQTIMDEYPYAVAVLDKLPRYYDASYVLQYNRNHKKGALVIWSCKQYLATITDGDRLLNEFAIHDFRDCRDGCRVNRSPEYLERHDQEEAALAEEQCYAQEMYDWGKSLLEAYPWRKVTKDDANCFWSCVGSGWQKNSLDELVKSGEATQVQVDETILWFNKRDDVHGLTYDNFVDILKDVQKADALIKEHNICENTLKEWLAKAVRNHPRQEWM